MRLRSAVSLLALVRLLRLASRQGRTIDEGTFTVTKTGAPTSPRAFASSGATTARSRRRAIRSQGTQQTRSTLTTDSLGTPFKYEMRVTDKGATVVHRDRSGARRDVSRRSSTTQARRRVDARVSDDRRAQRDPRAGPAPPALLRRRSASDRPRFQVIEPRARARPSSVTLTPKGLEPVDVGGKSRHRDALHAGVRLGSLRVLGRRRRAVCCASKYPAAGGRRDARGAPR